MPTPRLDKGLLEYYLKEAPKYETKQDMAKAEGLPYSTFKNRLASLGITAEVAELIKGGEATRFHQRYDDRLEESDEAKASVKVDIPLIEPGAPDVTGSFSGVGADIEHVIKYSAARFDLKKARANEKQDQRVHFTHGPVALFLISDTHFGGEGTDVQRAFDEQQEILNTPGAYVLFLGDVIDNYIIGKLKDENLNWTMPIYEQWQVAEHYLQKFSGRLLSVTGGNHDYWTKRISGLDQTREITPKGVLYDADETKLTVSVGDSEFRMWLRHKFQGSSIYNPTHGCERACKFNDPDYDIYAQGHVHKGAMAREFVHAQRRRIALLAGTYKAIDSYAIQQGFPAHDASTAVGVVLHDDGTYWATANIKAVQNYMTALYKGG